MTIQLLDFYFPFFVLAYGVLVTIVTSSQFFVRLAESRINPALCRQLAAHRGLAVTCLIVGALWSLQNIWVQPTDF